MAIKDITSSTVTYTVSRGDTFSEIVEQCIAVKMKGYEDKKIYWTGCDYLHTLNPDIEVIKNSKERNYLIFVGQKLTLQGTAKSKTKNTTQRAKITACGLQSKTANSNVISEAVVFATWAWDSNYTKGYEVEWKYGTGDGVGWVHKSETTEYKYSTCSGVPANATHVTFRVKPIPKQYAGHNDKKYTKITTSWTDTKDATYWFKDNPPEVPPKPESITVTEPTAASFLQKLWGKVTGKGTSSETGPQISVSLKDLNKSSLSGLYLNAHEVHFQFVKNDNLKSTKTVRAPITDTGTVSATITLDPGVDNYKVRCRAYRGAVKGSDNKTYNTKEGIYSDWSDFSDSFATAPAAVNVIDNVFVESKNSDGSWLVRVDIIRTEGDTSKYNIGYVDTNIEYFLDSERITAKEIASGYSTTWFNISDTGKTFYFSAQKVNTSTLSSDKPSPWCEPVQLVLGSKPSVPTVWASSNSAMLDDQVTLYWAHQSTDGSPESMAQLDLIAEIANNDVPILATVKLDENGEYILDTYQENVESDYITVQKQKNEYGQVISSVSSITLTFPSSSEYFAQGVKLKWRVRTCGSYTDQNGDAVYSEFTEYSQIDIYSKPTLDIELTDSEGSNLIGIDASGNNCVENPLTHFPLKVRLISNVATSFQKPINYHVAVVSTESYETVDSIGNNRIVKAGETIFSRVIDTDETTVEFELSAGDIDLENGQTYELKCTASMDSRLTAEQTAPFWVSWTDEALWPNLEIMYDTATYTTLLKPYCFDGSGGETLVSGVTLWVYRREFDGTFTKLHETGLNNIDETCVTDPHPALDFARYRVVAQKNDTGAVSYYDVPGFPIGEKAIIIQWDEDWQEFDMNENEDIIEYPWSGSLLRLPYNIDISDSHSIDVELISYIGRENPVSYYGTQREHSSTWNTEIPKYDVDTLYAIRRLARWAGNVYVREPSGSGYWATITVSYDQKHRELTIPITLSIRKVEGD